MSTKMAKADSQKNNDVSSDTSESNSFNEAESSHTSIKGVKKSYSYTQKASATSKINNNNSEKSNSKVANEEENTQQHQQQQQQQQPKKEGRKNRRSGRGSLEYSRGRKSTDSRGSEENDKSSQTTSDEVNSERKIADNAAADQLSQITDILLTRLISTLSDSTLGNPALLLQTLLGFSPDDYSDLLAALSESHLSYVDIISAYLHNIRVMSEDCGSTSAALSGTLTRSLIEQYNSLLAQAVKSPQSMARVDDTIGISDNGRNNLAELLQRNCVKPQSSLANAQKKLGDSGSASGLLKAPSGLGFGRRPLVEAAKLRQQQQNSFLANPTTIPTTSTSGADLSLLAFQSNSTSNALKKQSVIETGFPAQSHYPQLRTSTNGTVDPYMNHQQNMNLFAMDTGSISSFNPSPGNNMANTLQGWGAAAAATTAAAACTQAALPQLSLYQQQQNGLWNGQMQQNLFYNMGNGMEALHEMGRMLPIDELMQYQTSHQHQVSLNKN